MTLSGGARAVDYPDTVVPTCCVVLCCRGPDQCNNRDNDDDNDKDNDDDNVDKVTSLPARQVAEERVGCFWCCTLTVHNAVVVVQVLLLMKPETNFGFCHFIPLGALVYAG